MCGWLQSRVPAQMAYCCSHTRKFWRIYALHRSVWHNGSSLPAIGAVVSARDSIRIAHARIPNEVLLSASCISVDDAHQTQDRLCYIKGLGHHQLRYR